MRERKELQIILFNSECDRERCLCSQWTRSSTPCPASCWNAPRTWSTNTGSYWLEKPRWDRGGKIKRASASSQRCLGRQMMPCVTGECELASTAGESVGRDGDAGASLPPGWAMRFSRGQTESPQRSRWATQRETQTVSIIIFFITRLFVNGRSFFFFFLRLFVFAEQDAVSNPRTKRIKYGW